MPNKFLVSVYGFIWHAWRLQGQGESVSHLHGLRGWSTWYVAWSDALPLRNFQHCDSHRRSPASSYDALKPQTTRCLIKHPILSSYRSFMLSLIFESRIPESRHRGGTFFAFPSGDRSHRVCRYGAGASPKYWKAVQDITGERIPKKRLAV